MKDLPLYLGIAGIVGLLVWIAIQKRGIHLDVSTISPPEHIRATVISVMGRKKAWSIVADGGTTISYQYRTKPNVLIAFLLFWFFIIPAIIYLVVGGQSETLTISIFDPVDNAPSRRVQIVANGQVGRKLALKVRKQLAVA